MKREGGSPGAARAANELETGRRARRVPVFETDANPYRIPQSGMVAEGMKDWYEEVPIAEDGAPDPVDDMDVPPGDDTGDDTEAGADALAAPAANTYGDGDMPGRPSRPPWPARRDPLPLPAGHGPPPSASQPSGPALDDGGRGDNGGTQEWRPDVASRAQANVERTRDSQRTPPHVSACGLQQTPPCVIGSRGTQGGARR